MKLPIVGVLGSGRNEHAERAERLGRWLATQPVHLLTGGGSGVMAAVSRAFTGVPDRVGLVIGIIPGDVTDGDYVAPEGYPNRWVELTIRTHLPLSGTSGTDAMSRNHVNVLSADVLVALPGGVGTASELHLARRYRRAVIAFVDDATEIPGLPAGIPVASDLAEVRAFVKRHLASSA
jgi:uncharacterized protein (TIGR00725 family)